METLKPSEIIMCNDEDFLFRIEDGGLGVAHLHVDAKKWTPRSARKAYDLFVKAERMLKLDGFKTMVTVTPNPKFAHLFGGKSVDYLYHEDKYYEVVIWDLTR